MIESIKNKIFYGKLLYNCIVYPLQIYRYYYIDTNYTVKKKHKYAVKKIFSEREVIILKKNKEINVVKILRNAYL